MKAVNKVPFQYQNLLVWYPFPFLSKSRDLYQKTERGKMIKMCGCSENICPLSLWRFLCFCTYSLALATVVFIQLSTHGLINESHYSSSLSASDSVWRLSRGSRQWGRKLDSCERELNWPEGDWGCDSHICKWLYVSPEVPKIKKKKREQRNALKQTTLRILGWNLVREGRERK